MALQVDLAEMAVSKSAKPKQTKKEVSDGSTTIAEEKNEYLVSMGIYVFKKDVLVKLLKKEMPKALDFGSEILPDAVSSYMINAYRFDDYWEDIGTIKSFYKVRNLPQHTNDVNDGCISVVSPSSRLKWPCGRGTWDLQLKCSRHCRSC